MSELICPNFYRKSTAFRKLFIRVHNNAKYNDDDEKIQKINYN